jgi:hypothetical protein
MAALLPLGSGSPAPAWGARSTWCGATGPEKNGSCESTARPAASR